MIKKLIHKGDVVASFFVWVTNISAKVKISTTCEKNKMQCFYEDKNKEIQAGYNQYIEFKNTGIYCFRFSKGDNAEITVETQKGAYAFFLNGPGIMPYNNSIGALWIEKGSHSFYVAVPSVIKRFSVSYNSTRIEDVKVYNTKNEQQPAVWEPELDICPYHVEDFITNGNSGYWRADFCDMESTFKFNENNGLAIFFEEPQEEFLYNYFTLKNEQNLDYRVSVKRRGHIDGVFDVLYSENDTYPVVVGEVEFYFTAGISYKDKSIVKQVKNENEIEISFTNALQIPKGWLRGDLHVHSCYEDACSRPQRITKSGRCNGLDFMFLTDHGGENIIDNGLYTWKEEGRFLPLPGQECVNERTHMNFLNIPFNIDYQNKTEGEWIEDAKNKNPQDNDYVKMLNHPSHLPEATKGWWCTHFRSWWVATEHKDIELVENFDFITWFDHLTRGRKLIGIWTTDTHDGTIERPGDSCSFVYTGGELSDKAIVKALREGKVINSFPIGAFLNISANGKMVGETVVDANGVVDIKVEGMSKIQLEKIDIIANGLVAKSFKCGDNLEFLGECRIDFSDIPIKGKKNWVLAIMYHKDHEFYQNPHSQFRRDHVAAFTNPIYVE